MYSTDSYGANVEELKLTGQALKFFQFQLARAACWLIFAMMFIWVLTLLAGALWVVGLAVDWWKGTK